MSDDGSQELSIKFSKRRKEIEIQNIQNTSPAKPKRRKYTVCSHGKTRCSSCGVGIKKCVHGKEQRRCMICGGIYICMHGKQKSHCRECGGTVYCQHGKRKSRCVDCGGCGVCIHKKLKEQCRDCNGASFCHHGNWKTQCKDCKGSAICHHGKHKASCKECVKFRREHGTIHLNSEQQTFCPPADESENLRVIDSDSEASDGIVEIDEYPSNVAEC